MITFGNALLAIAVASIVFPVAIVLIHCSLIDDLFEHIVSPSFDLRLERLFYLIVSYFIFATVILRTEDLVTGHFHIERFDENLKLFIPGFIYFLLRCIVRFHSSRTARHHLDTMAFLLLAYWAVTLGIHFATWTPLDLVAFPWAAYGIILLSGVLVVVPGDILLSMAPRIPFLCGFTDTNVRLIDLTEQLPISMRYVVGRKQIDERIHDLIEKGTGELSILTNTYATVSENATSIERRSKTGTVKIIGDDDQFSSTSDEILRRLTIIEDRKILVCRGRFEKIRLIVDCNKRVLLSFATAGWKGSHIGIYSEHQFVVSLFKSYFDTKCKALKCDHKCTRKLL